MKLRAGSKKYYRACAFYAYNLFMDMCEKEKIDAVGMVDILDSLYDIIYDSTEMKETLENELPDGFLKDL